MNPVYTSENGRWQTIVLDDGLIEIYDLEAATPLQETVDVEIGELRFTNRPAYVPLGGGQYLNYQAVMRRAVFTVRRRALGEWRWQRGSRLS